MSPIDYTTNEGIVTIGGVLMHCPAWHLSDVLDLWLPADVRGSDVVIPGASGVLPQERRRTVTARSLPIAFAGEVDRLGVRQANPWEGLEANIDYIRANVVDPTNVGDGTRAATLAMPSGEVRSGNIHVLNLRIIRHGRGINLRTGMDGVAALGFLDISIPAGVLG